MSDQEVSWGISGSFAQAVVHWRRLKPAYGRALLSMYQQTGWWPPWQVASVPESRLHPMERDFYVTGQHAVPVEPWLVIDYKLSRLLELAYLDEAPVMVASRCELRGSSLVFWASSAVCQPGELLEVLVSLSDVFPLLVRAVVRLADQQEDATGMHRVHCHLLTCQLNGMRDYSPPSSSQSTLAITAPGRSSEDEEPSLEDMPELQRQAISAGRRAHNRRQSHRLKDEISLNWKILTPSEFGQMSRFFQENGLLPPRDKETSFRFILRTLDERLARLAEAGSRLDRPCTMMRQQLEILFFRANTQEEEDRIYRTIERLLALVEALSRYPTLPDKISQLVTNLRWQLELQQQRDWKDHRTDPKLIRDMPMTFKRLHQDVGRMLLEMQESSSELAGLLAKTFFEVETINLKRYDRAWERDRSTDLLTTHTVNISDSGIGFHTRNWEAPVRGNLLAVSMNLVTEEGPLASFRCCGQVMEVKPPSADGIALVGCQYTLIQKEHQDLLFRYLAIRQRERLAKRIK